MVDWSEGGCPVYPVMVMEKGVVRKADESKNVKTGDTVKTARMISTMEKIMAWSCVWEPSRTSPPFHPSPPSRGM